MELKSPNDAVCYINEIRFTPREVDIISCIISGRSVKSIANLLNISTKTTDNHIRSIMAKFGCNSKDVVARIVEKSREHYLLVKHYQSIYRYELLNEAIKKIKLSNEAEKRIVIHNFPKTESNPKTN